MKHVYLVLFFITSYLSVSAQNFQWVSTIEKGNNILIATDAAGSTYVYGYVTDSVELGTQTFYSSNGGAYIARYDNSGSLLNAVQLDSVIIYSMLAAGGHLYIAGEYADDGSIGSFTMTGLDTRDSFWAKLDPSLNVVQHVTGVYDGRAERFSSIEIDNIGNIYVTGSFRGDSLTVGSTIFTGTDNKLKAFLLKFLPTGNLTFSQVWEMSGNADISGDHVLVDATSGNIFMTFDESDDADKDSVSFGSLQYKSVGLDNDLVVMFNSSGAALAVQNITDIFQEGVIGADLDASGYPYLLINHYVAGSSILKLDLELDTLWSSTANASEAVQSGGLIVNGSQVFYSGGYQGSANFGGNIPDTSYFKMNGFLHVLDTAGNFIAIKTTESADDVIFYDVSTDAAGNIYLGGKILSSTTFDTIAVNATGETGVLAKISAGIFVNDPEQNSKVLSLYPNPANEVINLVGVEGYDQLELYDVSGRTISTMRLTGNTITCSVEGSKPGIYMLRLSGENGTRTIRFVKTAF